MIKGTLSVLVILGLGSPVLAGGRRGGGSHSVHHSSYGSSHGSSGRRLSFSFGWGGSCYPARSYYYPTRYHSYSYYVRPAPVYYVAPPRTTTYVVNPLAPSENYAARNDPRQYAPPPAGGESAVGRANTSANAQAGSGSRSVGRNTNANTNSNSNNNSNTNSAVATANVTVNVTGGQPVTVTKSELGGASTNCSTNSSPTMTTPALAAAPTPIPWTWEAILLQWGFKLPPGLKITNVQLAGGCDPYEVAWVEGILGEQRVTMTFKPDKTPLKIDYR